MTLLKKNISANLLGKAWSLLVGLLFVPLYIHFLGIEAYGLVGFFVALQGTVFLLEFGLSATMNREMARYSIWPDRADEARDLARTLEAMYWAIGIVIAVLVCLSAPWIATHWVRTETLSPGTVKRAVAMMGISIAFQWPTSLYSGGMMGLERQVLLNSILAVFGTVRGLGAVVAIWLIAPTITIFFAWQILASIVQVGALAFAFWRAVPAGTRAAQVGIRSLRGVWRFTAGMGATGFATFLLSQLDKVVLSRLVSLSMFGYYNVASAVNSAARMPSNAVFAAFLPRMSSLFASEDDEGLRTMFHKGCQFVSFLVLPASAVFAFYSREILFIWTRNASVADVAAPIASLLVVGSAFNSIMGIPYDLTVARGWAMFGFYQNAISAAVLVPVMLVLVTHFGGVGAAVAWLGLNVGYVLVAMPIIAGRVVPGELRSWYVADVGPPFLLSFGLAGVAWWLGAGVGASRFHLPVIVVLWVAAQAGCAFALPYIRQSALQVLRNGRVTSI